jgi:hypothetical protein
MAKLRLFYVRFMDDILILTQTHWQLRRAVKVVNQTLGVLSLEKHPDKTFIGKIERGFDFLGYHFSPAGLTMAKQTITNFIEKASQLYEQERRVVSAASPLEMYVRQWLKWARAGVADRARRSSVASESSRPGIIHIPVSETLLCVGDFKVPNFSFSPLHSLRPVPLAFSIDGMQYTFVR